MPFLVPVFANNMARYFDPESPAYEGVTGDVSGVASPGTAKGWSESLKLASTAIFPPSVTIPAAEAAPYGILAGWSTNNDSAGNVLKSAIDAFYATYAAGCLPAFAAVPLLSVLLSQHILEVCQEYLILCGQLTVEM